MINIQVPANYEEERRYILSVIFGEFLRDKYKVSTVGLKSAEDENVAFYPIERKGTSFFS